MKTLSTILFAALFAASAIAQVGTITKQVLASTNGAIVAPTNIWTANLTGIRLAIDLDTSINGGTPNGSGALVHWSKLLGVPAGFADGTDDGAGGGSGTMTGITLTNSASLPFLFSPNSTTASNTFTLSPSNQVANVLYAGPSSGSAAAPGFRSVVDDDIPNTITIDLAAVATVANSGDSATAFFTTGTIEDARIDSALARDSEVAAGYQPLDADLTTLATLNGASLTNLNGTEIRSGTVADARIDSAIARDAEVAAAYQPLDSDLTAMAAGTAVATAQTNAVSVGAPVLYVGTTNVAAAISGISGGGGNVYTSSNNVMTGTNTFSGMITLGSLSRTNFLPSATELYFFTEFLTGTSGTTTTAFLPFQGNAINSGAVAAAQGLTNHPGIITVASASGTANSGYAYTCNATALIPRPGDFFRISFRPFQTNNGARVYLGFLDQGGAASAPTDGLCLFRSNVTIYGQAWNNSVLVQTINSATITSNTWYSAWGHIVDDSVAQFIVTDETGASVLNETVTNGVPFTRGYGAGFVAFYTNSPGASANLEQFDNVHVGSLRNILR